MTAVDAAGLQAALAESISGEVRFDRLSRALYSTDASVYQIVPLGVVCRRPSRRHRGDREDVHALRRAADGARRRHLAGRASASDPASCSIARSYFDRVLEINAAERWARVEPGCVLDDLNRELKPLGLQFAAGHLHVQPRHHRRHDRQQLVRHAFGHLRQDHRSRPRTDAPSSPTAASSTRGR